jgi:hypothetical protein
VADPLVDYALSPVVTSWVVWKVVEALPKIANSEPSKVLERYSRWIALAAGLSIILRYFLEGPFDPKREGWRIGIHMTFVISGVLFALMDNMADRHKSER